MTAHLPACNDCQATIRWVRMRSGKSMPVEPVRLTRAIDGTTVGNVACTVLGNRASDGHVISKAEPAGPGEYVFRPHWAACPKGKTKPRTKTTEQPTLFG